MDPQQLEELNKQLANLNQTLGDLGTSANKASTNLSDELAKKLPNAAKPSIAALQGLGNAAADTAAALYRGERGAKVMADGLDKLVDGIQTAVAIFTFLTPLGKGLSLGAKLLMNGAALAAKAFSTYNKLAAEQSDRLFKTYQDLSKFGAAGAGMAEVMDNLQRMGLTTAEIDQYTAVMRKNAKELVGFGVSAADGARNLSAISGAITKGDVGYQLMMMGYSAADIAESTATYMNLQVRLGRLQTKTMTEIANESGRYAMELDKLARLTGQTREEQEQAQKSLLEDERYVGFLAQAEEMGQNVENLEAFLRTLPAEMQRGYMHIAAGRGAVSSEEARRLYQTDPQAYQRVQSLLNNQISASQATQDALNANMQFTKQFGAQMAIGATGEFGIRQAGAGGPYMRGRLLQQQQAAAAKLGMTVDEYIEQEQKRAQATGDAKDAQVSLLRKQMSAAQSLDTFVNLGVNPATKALDGLAGAASGAAKRLPGTPAGGYPTTAPPAAAGAPRTAADIRSGRGLRVKGNELTSGGSVSDNLVALAQQIQSQLGPDLVRFTAGNDMYHQGTNSAHAAGRALDFTIADPSKAAQIAAIVRAMPGVTKVLDEYNNPSSRATAGHIHAEISAMLGGVFSGPKSGYAATLHGNEAVVPLPDGRTIPVRMDGMSEALGSQIDRLDQLIRLMQTQVSTSQKLLQYTK